jgi:hypothetical protein
MNVVQHRTARRAVEATIVERTRALTVERAIAAGMIAAIGMVAIPMLGEGGPASAMAEGRQSPPTDTRTAIAPDGRQDRYRHEKSHMDGQGLRDGRGGAGR